MRPWERRAFNLAAVAVTVTGVAYFWMKYVVRNDDPFAVVNHPWQAAMLALHVLASPPFILIFGIVLNSHIIVTLARISGAIQVLEELLQGSHSDDETTSMGGERGVHNNDIGAGSWRPAGF